MDSGPFHVADELMDAFADTPVKILINTHHHEDHIGNNAWFQKYKNCGSALAHELAIPIISNASKCLVPLPAYRELTWGVPPDSMVVTIGSEVETENYCFKVLETPGHSADHISLFEPQQGWLFAGDLYLAEKVITIMANDDPNIILNSLKEILSYDFNILFCSSGTVVEKDAKKAVKDKIAFWEDIKEKVTKLNNKGFTPEEIRDNLFGKESSRYYRTNGEFAKIHLVNAFITGNARNIV